MVDLVVAIEVVVEEKVAGLEFGERDVTKLRPLSFGGARYRETRLGPGPLDEAGAVEAGIGRALG